MIAGGILKRSEEMASISFKIKESKRMLKN